MNKQQKNGIEYLDYTYSPISGCLRDCEYCYMKRMATRFQQISMKPAFHPERLIEPGKVKKPAIIGVTYSGDMWGEWVPEEWIEQVLDACRQAHWHKFLFLTKNPKRYGEFAIPENCWTGTSTTGNDEVRILDFHKYAPDRNRFISLEPFTGLINKTSIYLQGNYQWLIIGGLTGKNKKTPPTENVTLIVTLAQAAGIRVFIKSNAGYPETIQQYPEGLTLT